MRCNAHEGVYEQGKEAGVIIGIKIGEEKGIKIGEKIKSHEIAKNLLLLGTSIEIIVKSTGLSLEDVRAIYNEIKH